MPYFWLRHSLQNLSPTRNKILLDSQPISHFSKICIDLLMPSGRLLTEAMEFREEAPHLSFVDLPMLTSGPFFTAGWGRKEARRPGEVRQCLTASLLFIQPFFCLKTSFLSELKAESECIIYRLISSRFVPNCSVYLCIIDEPGLELCLPWRLLDKSLASS